MIRSCASLKRSRERVGSAPKVKYSTPMPRTKPLMMRPPDTQSSTAISSATRNGWSRSGSALPMIAIFIRFVSRTIRAAITSGHGIMPYVVW